MKKYILLFFISFVLKAQITEIAGVIPRDYNGIPAIVMLTYDEATNEFYPYPTSASDSLVNRIQGAIPRDYNGVPGAVLLTYDPVTKQFRAWSGAGSDSISFADTSYYSFLTTYLIDTTGGFVGVAEDGNLGIGTSTPTAKLEVRQNEPENLMDLYSGSTNLFTFTSGGELGIGSDITPEYKLDVRYINAIQGGNGSGIAQTVFKGNAGTNQDVLFRFLPVFYTPTIKAWEWQGESAIKGINYRFTNFGGMNIVTLDLGSSLQTGWYHTNGSYTLATSNIWYMTATDSSENYRMKFTNYNGSSLPGGLWTRNILTLDAYNNKIGINDTVPNSTLDVNGSIEAKYTISGTNYNALNDDYTIEMTSSGDTLFLPAGSGNKEYNVINVSAGNIIIIADGSETIGNISPSGSLTIATGEVRGLVWNGSIWRIKY